jgi:hypothetical protein
VTNLGSHVVGGMKCGVFYNRVAMKRILRPKKKEVTGE